MKKVDQDGFSLIGALLVLVIVGVLGVTGWLVYQSRNKTDKPATSTTSSNETASSSDKKGTVTPDPYAGWKTYTSSYEKLSFKYPGDWTTRQLDGLIDEADVVAMAAPTGKFEVTWNSAVDGMGGACDDSWTPESKQNADSTLGLCPYWFVTDKQKLENIDAYYVAGVMQTGDDNPQYTPWCALQPSDGVLTSKSVIFLPELPTKNSSLGAELSCNTPDTKYGSYNEAAAQLSTEQFKQAKLILVSARY